MEAYCRAKLANVLFTRELARAHGAAPASPPTRPTRAGCAAASAWTATHGHGAAASAVRPFEISPGRGAKTSIYLATSPDVATKTGDVLGPFQARSYGQAAPATTSGRRLWDESERLLAAAGYPVT